MTLPDPLAPLHGGVLHELDIRIAEGVTGVPNRSISRHMAQPLVNQGVRSDNAVTIVHYALIGAAILGFLAFLASTGAMRR
jgi:hypothetical protein